MPSNGCLHSEYSLKGVLCEKSFLPVVKKLPSQRYESPSTMAISKGYNLSNQIDGGFWSQANQCCTNIKLKRNILPQGKPII
jgi:hypothetical protein